MKINIKVPLADIFANYTLNDVYSITHDENSPGQICLQARNSESNVKVAGQLFDLVMQAHNTPGGLNDTQVVYRGTLQIGEEIYNGVFVTDYEVDNEDDEVEGGMVNVELSYDHKTEVTSS